MNNRLIRILGALGAAALALSACAPAAMKPAAEPAPTAAPTAAAQPTAEPAAVEPAPLKIGLILVGPKEDRGWSQGHFEGLTKVTGKVPGVTFDYVDKVNAGDRPNIKSSDVADDLIAKGARMVIFASEDYKDDALTTAQKHPDVGVIHVGADYAWPEGQNYKNQKNLGNVLPQLEVGEAIAGCAAALTTQTGKIGFLGPVASDAIRRYVNAAYLGARYCWETYAKKPAADLQFKVVWIGFFFNIPGVTLDPTKVADDFFTTGYDVVISGLDTPEAAVQAQKMSEAGKPAWYVHSGSPDGCALAPAVCVGTRFANWEPAYIDAVTRASGGDMTGTFAWLPPDWTDLNNPETSAVSFKAGDALGDNKVSVDAFIRGMGDGSIVMLKGPLEFQDGTVYLKEGETATPQQAWYVPQLVKGIEGPSQ